MKCYYDTLHKIKFCKHVLTSALVDLNELTVFTINIISLNYYVASPRSRCYELLHKNTEYVRKRMIC